MVLEPNFIYSNFGGNNSLHHICSLCLLPGSPVWPCDWCLLQEQQLIRGPPFWTSNNNVDMRSESFDWACLWHQDVSLSQRATKACPTWNSIGRLETWSAFRVLLNQSCFKGNCSNPGNWSWSPEPDGHHLHCFDYEPRARLDVIPSIHYEDCHLGRWHSPHAISSSVDSQVKFKKGHHFSADPSSSWTPIPRLIMTQNGDQSIRNFMKQV